MDRDNSTSISIYSDIEFNQSSILMSNMESTHKQKRFFSKSKLVKSFSRVVPNTKRTSHQLQCTSKVRPTPSSSQNGSAAIFANRSSMQSVSYASATSNLQIPASTIRDPNGFVNATSNAPQKSYVNAFWGYGGDENVDAKAATYISYVRERFKLERADSTTGSNMYQERL